MNINKFYRVPILAACLLLIVTGVVFKTIKVKAAGNQCFTDCDAFNNYLSSYGLCPSGSVLQYSSCGGSGWNVLCMKQVPIGTDPARCYTWPVCSTIYFQCQNPPRFELCESFVCKAQFGSCGPYTGDPHAPQPYIYAGTGGAIMETCGQ